LAGKKHNYNHDWSFFANQLRKRSLKAMLNLGKDKLPDLIDMLFIFKMSI
jgi:hypothetical protein